MNDQSPITPRLPDTASLDLSQVVFDYDRPSDTLIVQLFGRGKSAVIPQSGGFVDFLLDPAAHGVVGFQIEGYFSHVVYQDPRFLSLANLASIDPAEIERVRATIAPDKQQRAGLALLEQLTRATA